MYFCQHSIGATVREIAECCNHQHYRSASDAINQVRQRKRTDKSVELKLQVKYCWKAIYFRKEWAVQENGA